MEPFYKLFNCACGCGKCETKDGDAKIVNDVEEDDGEEVDNRASSKTAAKPSADRILQHVNARKDAAGIRALTPDRVARMEAAARTAEYRERIKAFPVTQEDGTVEPLHESGVQQPLETTPPQVCNRSETEGLQNGKACGDGFIADDKECRAGAANAASEKADKSGLASDHRNADEAHVQAAMAFSRATDNKPSTPETRALIAKEFHHSDRAKQHRDAAVLAERIDKHNKEMHEAGSEYHAVKSFKDSSDPELKAKHDAAYDRLKAAHVEQQSIAAKQDGFNDVAKWIEFKRGKIKNDERAIAELDATLSNSEFLGIAVNLCDKLTNRFSAPADGWIHIAPYGEHSHPQGVMQVLDDKAFDAMVTNFKAKKQDASYPGALVDYDHFSQAGDKPSEAAGWIDDVEKRADGLWAHTRWTDTGEAAVNGGRYRLVSPVWLKKNCETLDGNRLRPLVLDSVALTNEPNLKGLTPISV